MKKRSMILLVAFVALATIATATPLTNGTLACPTCAATGFTTLLNPSVGLVTGWNIAGAGVIFAAEYSAPGVGWQSSDGLHSSIGLNIVDPGTGGTNYGSIDQLLTGLTVGTTYTLFYDLSAAPGGKALGAGGANNYGFRQMNLLITGTPGAFVTYNYQSDNLHNKMNWETRSFTFTATTTSAVLTFQSATPDSYFGVALDNVHYQEGGPIPEPGTFSLLIGGALAGLAFVKFRK
jgi:hypothetical protein